MDTSVATDQENQSMLRVLSCSPDGLLFLDKFRGDKSDNALYIYFIHLPKSSVMLEIIVSGVYVLGLVFIVRAVGAEFRQVRPQTPALAEEKPTLAKAA
jgi:hypothetical protein